MKTNKKQLFTALVLGVVMLILFVGGCKKEISSSGGIDKPDVIMGTGGKGVSTKVVRQSPGLKVQATGQKINQISQKLRHPEKLEAALKELGKKKKAPAITVSDATFSASLSGSVYNCSIDFPDLTGDKEFWIVNTLTWVYTYATASSTSYATFNVNKPLLPGTYRVYGEDAYSGTQYSNEITLGDAYSGVSVNSGIMTFTDQTAYRALKTRLTAAYDNHQTYLDVYDSMSDAAANAQAVADGFNEFLTYEEFEAYFGFSSLRAQIRSEVLYWQTISNEYVTYPEDSYPPYSYAQQALMTTEGQIEIGGVGEGPTTLDMTPGRKRPSNYTSSTCMTDADSDGSMIIGTNRKLKLDIYINPQDEDDNDVTTFEGRSRTMNKFLGVWKDVKERQKVRVSGTHYTACGSPTSFDSDYTNPSNKRRYSQTVEFPVGPNRSSKEDEITTSAMLSDFSSSAFTETYHH